MIEHGICNSFKLELLKGTISFTDRYMLALYDGAADLGKHTSEYTVAHEVSGMGYVLGGRTMTGMKVEAQGDDAGMTWDEVAWPNTTIRARAGLIYNADRANLAVAVVDFKRDVASTNGPFTVSFNKPLIILKNGESQS